MHRHGSDFRFRVSLIGTLLLLFPGLAGAQSIFVPVDFGAAYEPHQLNQQAVQSAIEDGRYGMLSAPERDLLLEAHFPSLSLPDVTDLKIDLDAGNQAYFNGEYDKAANLLTNAIEASSRQPVALTLRPAFADTVYQSGLYLIQIYYFVLEKPNEAEVVIEKLVQYFPTQVPSEEQFPPDLVEVYRKYLPGAATGKTLSIKVAPGCAARVNGMDLPQGDATLVVLAGEYGIAEVCNDQPTRAWVIPVQRDLIVDFHGAFAQAYTYPVSLTLNGRTVMNDPSGLGELGASIGDRIGVSHLVAGGLVATGDAGDGYRLVLVDVAKRRVVRELTVPPAEVATPEGMRDALNALWTGEEFQVISVVTSGGGASWTTFGLIGAGVGGALVIGGSVFGVLAKGANDEFFTCNADPACRASEQDKTHLEDRKTSATIADSLYIVGGVFLVTGGVLVILDQAGVFSGESDAAADVSGDWTFSVSPTPDGGVVGLHLTW